MNMKSLLILLLLLASSTLHAFPLANSPEYSQQMNASWHEATNVYPECLTKGTPIYNELIREYDKLEVANPRFFDDPDWPFQLATQAATELKREGVNVDTDQFGGVLVRRFDPSTAVPTSSLHSFSIEGLTFIVIVFVIAVISNWHRDKRLTVQKRIKEGIKWAFVTAIISSGISLLFGFLAFSGVRLMANQFDPLAGIGGAVLFAGLGYGVKKFSRTCAVLLFCMLLTEIAFGLYLDAAKPVTLCLPTIVLCIYYKAILATWAYHKEKLDILPVPPPPPKKVLSWYVYVGEQVKGPFSADQIKALSELNAVFRETPCCPLGSADWVTVGDWFN
jgi:hypothetical protein